MLLRCNRAVREGKAAWRPCEAAGRALWACAVWDFSWERLVSAPLGFRKIQGAFLAVRPGERLFSKQAGGPLACFEKREPAKGRGRGENKRNEKGHGEKAEKYGLSRPWGLRRDALMLQKGFERPFDRGELLWSSRNTEAKCRI